MQVRLKSMSISGHTHLSHFHSKDVEVYRDIKKRLKTESMRDIQKEYPVSLGTLSRIAKGEMVKDAKLRRELKLPAFVSVPVCHCGEVHTKECRPSFAKRLSDSKLTNREKACIYALFKKLNCSTTQQHLLQAGS